MAIFFKNPKQTSVHIHSPWTLYTGNMADNGSFLCKNQWNVIFLYYISPMTNSSSCITVFVYKHSVTNYLKLEKYHIAF